MKQLTFVYLLGALALVHPGPAPAAEPAKLSPTVQQFVRFQDERIVLSHVRVIDGTGKPAMDDRDIVIESGKIARIAPSQDHVPAKGAAVLDLHGYTVIPGLVGMHNHLYYVARPNLKAAATPLSEPPVLIPQELFSAPRLYLAAGVTTMRTTGSVEPYADLNMRDQIDAGLLPGPHIDVTAPYLEGKGSSFIQMHEVSDPQEVRRFVDYWASVGVTSFKAYTNLTRAELQAAIEAVHAHGLKITGHLCAVTYAEAAELGIDDLEHGFGVNTQLDPGKKPDACPETRGVPTLKNMDPDGSEAARLIGLLVARHVAITSTLPVFEPVVAGRPPLRAAVLKSMSPEARDDYFYLRNRKFEKPDPDGALLWSHMLQMERRFVAAGGLLIAGPDPTGNGAVLPGFGDQRELELLVEAGFTPEEAIRIATLNGAIYEGKDRLIGSIEAGKNADLVVIKGDPSRNIADVENTEIVFKDGIGFDSAKLIDSVAGRYGQY